ncbi:bacteriocin immunity protein [Companilactobacillus sp. HBUAS56257]|uniref:bacteriocin immunity protein n=1 Tax=Companilactobacillus sp. HBUAS56257 TaxID=3109360 RepID=UPI002FF37500
MNELIRSEELSAEEKKILSDAKTQLNNNVDDEKVAVQLRSRLSILSIKGSLSATVVLCFY